MSNERVTPENIDWAEYHDRALDAKVGDRLVIYHRPTKYAPEGYFQPITVTKIGRKWFSYELDGYGRSSRTDRYAELERGANAGLAFTDGGDFSQHSYPVYGFLDWEEVSYRKWVDEVIRESDLQWKNYSSPPFPKREALAKFLSESPLFETPAPE